MSAYVAEYADYDLLIFISTNAVKYSADLLPSPKKKPSRKHIAAVGKQTTAALEDIGYPSVISPESPFDSESLLRCLEALPLDGQRALLIRGIGGRETLKQGLEARGMHVDIIEVYERRLPTAPQATQFDSSQLDYILFSSAESADNLLTLLPSPSHQAILETQVVVGHSRIGQRVGGLNFKKKPIIARDPSNSAMLRALVDNIIIGRET